MVGSQKVIIDGHLAICFTKKKPRIYIKEHKGTS